MSTFQCAMCRGVFEKGISDEQAMLNAVEAFGAELAAEDSDLVCDECYQKIRPDQHPDELKAAQEELAKSKT